MHGFLERIEGIDWTIGEGAPRTYYNVMALNDGVASFAGGWVDTVSPEATRAVLPELQRQGIGSQLVSAGLATARERGYDQGPRVVVDAIAMRTVRN